MGSIMFAFNLFFTVLSFSFAFALLVFIPITIYVVPYCIWCGTLKGKKLMKTYTKQGIFKFIKNATILYASWISRKEPKFK